VTRVVIVTGATGTIGTSICRCLMDDGWCVVAADVVAPDDPSDHPHFVQADVTSEASVAALFEAATALGTVLGLVINHGVLRRASAGIYDEALVQDSIEVNLKGTLRLLTLASRHVADGGAIVQISTVSVSTGAIQGSYIYQATKAGIEQLTRFFAVALGPKAIRVNTVAPGFMEQPMRGEGSKVRTAPGNAPESRRSNALGRSVKATEVANAVAFLCSPSASGITGVVLPVDCGFRIA